MQYHVKKFNWRWFLKAVLVCTLLIFAGFYICMCPVVNPDVYAQILFHPEKKTDGPWQVRSIAGHPYEDVYFQAKNGNKLHGWMFEVPAARYTFLFNHGNGANLSYRTDELALLLGTGSSVFTYDYEGYGLSEGRPTIAGVADNAGAAYDYLVQKKQIAPDRIIIFGESLGTAIAGNLAAKVQSAGIILQCPLASVRRRGCELFFPVMMYPDMMWPESGFDNLAVFREKHPPLLIIAGTNDPMIPVAHADDLYRAASEPKTYLRIEGAGHTGDPKLVLAPAYAEHLKEFVSSLDATASR